MENNSKITIEEQINRLNEIAEKVANPNVSLEESLDLVKEANALIKDVEEKLQKAKEILNTAK